MLSVTYYYRAPGKTTLSIEGIFSLVASCLKNKIEIKDFYCNPALSRQQNINEAKKHTSIINHITGDVNFLAIGLRNKKNILTIHDFGHYENLAEKSRLRYFLYRFFWFRLPLRNVSVVTVVSDFTKEKLIKYFAFPEERIRVIPNPVKPIFLFDKKERSNDLPHILQIGTGPHKNLKNLIEAVKDIKVHLDIIGYPDEADRNKLNEYKIAHNIYNNLNDDEVYQRYIKCDILFFASHHEGFGMPIIEAQAVGRPVVTSNLGAMKEVAKDSAVLVDPKNISQIATAITSLINDPILYTDRINAGIKNIAPYHHTIVAEQYLKVYMELAKK